MRNRPVLAMLVVSALALAGCASGGGDDPAASTSGSLSSSGSSTGLPNRAPTAQLNASIENGTAPLNVTFTLDGADPDKDPLNWTLTFGDGNQTNGTELPATVSHSFPMGNFSVAFTVGDGRLNATRLANVTVGAASGAVEQAPVLHTEGSAALPCVICPLQYNVCAGMLAGENEVQCFYFDVPAEAAGRTATFSNEAGPVSADFMTSCDGDGDGIDYFADEASPHAFEIPDGTTCIVVYDSTNPAAAFVVDIA